MQTSRMKRTAALLLCVVMVIAAAMPAFAAGNSKAVENNIPNSLTTYSRNGYTFEKVSHAAQPTETFDGVADYLGNHVIAPYVPGESEEGKGDSVQSYSYCAATSGDWVYIGTMYGALSAYNQAKAALTNLGVDGDMAVAIVDAMFNGKLNKGKEADDYYAGSIFFKFNVVTGETKLLMSREMYEKGECTGVPIFRSAVEYNGKLYFVGLISNGEALKSVFYDMYYQQFIGQGMAPQMAAAYANAAAKQHGLNMEIMMQSGIPSIYELDPATDELKMVYECVSLEDYLTLNGDPEYFRKNGLDPHAVFTSTRAISTYKDYLIAGGIQMDARYPSGIRPDGYPAGDACVMAVKDPGSGDFKVIATIEDLFDYPAIWRNGSSGGGGIYQTIEYNGSLYVAIVSGNFETKNEVNGQFRPFAVVRGDYDPAKGAVDDRNAWTWTPVIGDKADGAKYTFGIDPARTASSACTLQVYDGYLYIGEYNDVNGSLTSVLRNNKFNTLRHNLEQSINLYRMDANENIEMVVGDPTEMFPASVSGWGSGYETHMTQYTWMTTVFDDTMYLSTMDETSLLHTFAQVVNGELLTMSREEWESQINYIKVLVEMMKPKMEDAKESIKENIVEGVHDAIGIMPLTEEEPEEVTEEPVEEEVKTPEDAQAVVEAVVESLDDVDELTEEQIEDAVDVYMSGALENIDTLAVEETENLTESLDTMTEQLTSDDIASFYAEYSETLDAFEKVKSMLPEEIVQALEMVLKIATRDNIRDFLVCMKYMTGSTAGFDLYAIKTNGDGVDITTVTTNGFNDRYNHGLRIFAATDDYMTIGTANPFNGTQLWRMAKSPEKCYSHTVHHFDKVIDHKDPAVGEEGYDVFVCTECDETCTKVIDPLDPEPTPTPTPDPEPTPTPKPHKPKTDSTDSSDNTSRPAAVTAVKPVSPKTGDNSMAIVLMAVAGVAALAGAHSFKRREE